MEKIYQVPRRGSGTEFRKAFWTKVIKDQIASGMMMTRFCRMHELSVWALKSWKRKLKFYGKRKKSSEEAESKINFIPVRISSDNTEKAERDEQQKVEFTIRFRNGHSISISTTAVSQTFQDAITQVGKLV